MDRRGAAMATAVALLTLAAACGSEGTELTENALRGDSEVVDHDETAADPDASDDEHELARRSYDPGDCVTWDEGSTRQAHTQVVDCTEPHRMQVTGKYMMPFSEDHPAPETWDALHEHECKALAEEFLGVPLDPFGRFAVQSIVPTAESWANSDRTVWCTVGPWREDPAGPFITVDVRTVDQHIAYEVGQCVSFPANSLPVVVPCEQPHEWEVTGAVDFADLAAPPGDEETDRRCDGPTGAYLGGRSPDPWGYGYEILAPESWAAGTRAAHCFLAQWDAAGNTVAVTGSVYG
jgi:hypothetical protein